MMLATRLEAEGKELDRQACAEAAGVLMSLNSAPRLALQGLHEAT